MIGTTLGHYRIVEQLGSGGMGVVYRAHDERLGRDLALKVLPAASLADETARSRLLREARTASSLNHPHICTIYEVLESDGSIAIAMELIEGHTLREMIQAAPLPVDSAARYGAQIADALAHAHERGVIHRDLKSANVVITPQGRAKVLDFGLAKRVWDESARPEAEKLSLTQSGLVVGTPPYLAPEVLSGAASDARSDIWALGVLLFEMVAGRLPFGGRSVIEVATAIVNNPPPPLPTRVSPGLRAAILRCLAKDPGQRYRTASELRAALETAQADSSGAAAGAHALRPRAHKWMRALLGAGLIAAVVVLALNVSQINRRLAVAGRGAPSPLPPGSPAVAAPRIGSLAVLPLANLSGDPSQEYFADGMTEELITSLAPIGSLKVISRTSVMRYKGTQKSLPDIARELGVDAVVEGSVLRAGNQVRITAQLIDAASDRHLWAKSYEREMKDVIGLQREVAVDIAEMIRAQVTPQEHERMTAAGRPVNPDANDLYLKGRFFWAKVTDASVRQSIDFFEQAIAIDPNDARFYTGLADAYVILAQLLETEPLGKAMPKVMENARKALALDETSAEAHTSMGAGLFFNDWDWAGSERELKRAIELSPGLAQAHFVYAVRLGAEGRVDEAIAEDLRARELDPLSIIINWNLGDLLMIAGRYDEALVQAKKTLEIDPTSVLPQSLLVNINEDRGDFQAALSLREEYLPEKDGGKAFVAELRAAYEKGGARAYWRVQRDRMKKNFVLGEGGACRLARLSALAGETDVALDYLEKGLAERSGDALFVNSDLASASLRGNPRYNEFLRRVGLSP